jgi:hypothetical protein
MDRQPRDPGEDATQPDPADVGYRSLSPDGGEGALVAVVEGSGRSPLGAILDESPGVPTLLHRYRRQARQDAGLSGDCVTDADHVADREYLRVAGQGQVGLDGHPPGSVDLGAGRLAERPGQR